MFKMEQKDIDEFVLYGIVICTCVFFFIFRNLLLPFLGRRFFYPSIKKEVDLEEIESRLATSFHVIPCVVLFGIAYFTTPEYYSEHKLYHVHYLITILGCWECGYSIYDTINLLRKSNTETELKMLVLHHVVSVLATYLASFHKQCQMGCGLLCTMEITAIFINNIFLFSIMGLRDSLIFKLNGLMIVLSWFFFRFVIGVGYLRYCIWKNWEDYYTNSTTFYFVFFEVVQLVFLVMNVFWFYKILEGFVKVLTGKKVDVVDGEKKEE